jgi:hypothetical protein
MGPLDPILSTLAPQIEQEQKFQRWYGPLARMMGIDPNPDAPEHHYDMRSLFRDTEGKGAVARGHFPSTYKTEGHPRSFLDDGTGRVFDTRTATYLDGSPVPEDRLRASEQSPDMPDFKQAQPRARSFMDMNIFEDQKPGRGPMPFRPPGQEGPMPPTGPLTRMYGSHEDRISSGLFEPGGGSMPVRGPASDFSSSMPIREGADADYSFSTPVVRSGGLSPEDMGLLSRLGRVRK